MPETPTTTPTDPKMAGQVVFSHAEIQEFTGLVKSYRDTQEKLEKEFGEKYSLVHGDVANIGKKLDDMEAGLQKKYDDFEARLNRKNTASADQPADEKAIKTKQWAALTHYLRSKSPGEEGARATEYKAAIEGYDKKSYIVSDDTLGGIFAQPEIVREMITDLQEVNPIRRIARQRTTANRSVKAPRRINRIAASWANEQDETTETQAHPFGNVEIFTHGLTALIAISREDLEDPEFDIMGFMRDEMREQFGIAEGIAFVNGTGNSQPWGFMNDADITSINSATSGSISADDFIEMYYDMHESYLSNVTWVMKRSTVKDIRTLKDGEGRYLWSTMALGDARPTAILGAPYIMADAMPTVAQGNYPVVLGNWRFYWIVDRISMEFITDPYTRKKEGFVEIMSRKRVGGQIVQPAAFRKLAIT